MVTGITIFVCIVVCCICLYVGYLAGCRLTAEKIIYAVGEAMLEFGIKPDLIDKVFDRGRELIKKEIGGIV